MQLEKFPQTKKKVVVVFAKDARVSGVEMRSLEEMCVRLRELVNFHFLQYRQYMQSWFGSLSGGIPYHLESIELLLDLLRQHGSETVASCNVAAPVVLRARPSVVKLDARAKADVARPAMRRIRKAPGATSRKTGGTDEVVVTSQSPVVIAGCAWCTGVGGVMVVSETRGSIGWADLR